MALTINLLFSATLVPFGFFTNLLSILVHIGCENTSELLSLSQSISDSLLLLLYFVFVLFLPSINVNLSLLSNSSCQFAMYSVRVVAIVSAWIQVLFALRRFALVTFSMCWLIKSRIRVFFIVFMILLIALIVEIPNFWFVLDIDQSNASQSNTTQTDVSCTSLHMTERAIVDLLTGLFRLWVPLLIILILNIHTFLKLHKIEKMPTLQQTTVEFILHIIYLAINTPFAVYSAIELDYKYNKNPFVKISPESIGWFSSVSLCLSLAFPIFPFFVRLLGDREFCKRVKFMLGCGPNANRIVDLTPI